MTQTEPPATTIPAGGFDVPIVATTSFRAGSMRETERAPALATQTDPAPTATATGASSTGIVNVECVSGSMRVTVSSSRFATHTASSPNAIDVGAKNAAPGGVHLMGTDAFGRDLFTRVLYGGRISMSIGFVAVGIAATIGTALGAIAAFAGGWVDRGLMWFVDLLLALPRLVLLLAITGMFRPTGPEGLFLMIAILGLTGWMGVSRIVRSEVLSLKERDFIQAARALGYSNARIVFRHLIPNALAPVIVYCSLAVGSTMITEAGR